MREFRAIFTDAFPSCWLTDKTYLTAEYAEIAEETTGETSVFLHALCGEF